MYLQSLATATPSCRLTQQSCWETFKASAAADRLRPRTRDLVRRVLLGDNGIEARHFALPPADGLFELDAEALNKAFEREAPKLGMNALRNALEQAELLPRDLDGLVVCTCTGYLCPGLSSFIAEGMGLRRDACLLDLVGLGCGAAIPSLRTAHGLLAANPTARMAVVAVELCSAAYYMDNDPGVIISACLFGDGAAAAIFSGARGPAQWRAHAFDAWHLPEQREGLRFENRGGKLRNRLAQSVPAVAAEAVSHLFERQANVQKTSESAVSAAGFFAPNPGGLPVQTPTAAPPYRITHGGGQRVLDALEQALGEQPLKEAREVLRCYGNLSSPSVLFALKEYLDRPDAIQEHLWLASFGAGFNAYACSLQREL